ncbi:MAG: hypothetical protein AB7Q42_05935 [Acidimicrobiia bacterium]
MSESDGMQPVVVRMPVSLIDEIRRVAVDEDRTVAQTIRRAVKQYLQQDATA